MSDRNRKRDRARWRGEYTSSMNVTIFFSYIRIHFSCLYGRIQLNFKSNTEFGSTDRMKWMNNNNDDDNEKNDKNSISRSANNGNEYCLTTPKSKAKKFSQSKYKPELIRSVRSFIRCSVWIDSDCSPLQFFFFCSTSLLLFRFVHGDLHCATYWECDFKRMLTATTTAAQSKKKSSAKVYVFVSQESPMQSQFIHTGT